MLWSNCGLLEVWHGCHGDSSTTASQLNRLPAAVLCCDHWQVRGPHYLSDHKKVAAGDSAYTLLSVDLVSTPTAVHHLARYLPSVRCVALADGVVCCQLLVILGIAGMCCRGNTTFRLLACILDSSQGENS